MVLACTVLNMMLERYQVSEFFVAGTNQMRKEENVKGSCQSLETNQV
jgi:hypothetical protein